MGIFWKTPSSTGLSWETLGKQEWWVYVVAVIVIIMAFVIINMIVRRINDAISERRLIAISTSTTHGILRANSSKPAAPIPAELKPLELKTTADISTKIETPNIYRNEIEKPAEKLTVSCDNKITSAITTACCVPTASFDGSQQQKLFLGMIYTGPNVDPNNKDEKTDNSLTTSEEIVLTKNVEDHPKEECQLLPGSLNRPDSPSNIVKEPVDSTNSTKVTDDVTLDSSDSVQNEIETSVSNTDTILSKVNDIILSTNTSGEENATDSKKARSPLPDYKNVLSYLVCKSSKTVTDLPELHTRSGVIIRRKSYVGLTGPSEVNLRNEFTIRRSSDPLMKEDLMKRKQCYPTPNRNSCFEVTDDDAYPKITCSKGFTNIQNEDNIRDWIEIMIVDRIMTFEPSTETVESKYFI